MRLWTGFSVEADPKRGKASADAAAEGLFAAVVTREKIPGFKGWRIASLRAMQPAKLNLEPSDSLRTQDQRRELLQGELEQVHDRL